MRRPVVDDSPQSGAGASAESSNEKQLVIIVGSKTTESRFSKVKRILTGTLMKGRSGTQDRGNVDKKKDGDQKVGGSPSDDGSTGYKSARKRDHSQESSSRERDLGRGAGLKTKKIVEKDGRAIKEQRKDRHETVERGNENGEPKKRKEKYETGVDKDATNEVQKPETRKRKERHESIGSSAQERKLIRSNSEEKAIVDVGRNDETNESKDIRRVSSHEDFKKNSSQVVKSSPLHELNKNGSTKPNTVDSDIESKKEISYISDSENIPTVMKPPSCKHQTRTHCSPIRVSPNRDPKSGFFESNESEHERRRSNERFSRPLAPRGRSKTTTGKKRKNSREHGRQYYNTSSSAFHKYGIEGNDEFHDNIDIPYSRSNSKSPIKTDQSDDPNAKTEKESSAKSEFHLAKSAETAVLNICNDSSIKLRYEHIEIEEPKRSTHVEQEECGSKKTQDVSKSPKAYATTPKSKKSDSHDSDSIPFDFSTLHEQVDDGGPVAISSNYLFTSQPYEMIPSQSANRTLLSPRNSIIMSRRIYMDPDIPIVSSRKIETINPIESRIKQVTKQINSLKKKIKKFEETFEIQNGYRPSHSDKMSDKKMKNYVAELSKLKKELKCLKTDPVQAMMMIDSTDVGTTISNLNTNSGKSRIEKIQETLVEVQKRLSDKRQHADRPEDIDQMTSEQQLDEKVAVQKSLLYLESVYGRPVGKEDRDIVRPLYDRYRTLKRLVARFMNAKLNNSVNELATILEHETMDFSSLPIQQESIESTSDEPETTASTSNLSTDSSDTDTSIGENLHSLPLNELFEQLKITREEKNRLRVTLKEFERDFQLKTGRKLQKDERTPMEGTYANYKQIKAKLKLLEALVTKHTQLY